MQEVPEEVVLVLVDALVEAEEHARHPAEHEAFAETGGEEVASGSDSGAPTNCACQDINPKDGREPTRRNLRKPQHLQASEDVVIQLILV